MKNKYLNEALIGNDNIVVSFSEKGELLRLFYPTRDYRQFVDKMYTGVKINDSSLIYLHEDINNTYNQYFEKDTNVLNTEIENKYFNIKILQTDFVPIKQDLIIKKYQFTNNNSIDLNVDFLIYSNLLSNFNDMVGANIEDDIFMQYSHNYTFSIFSNNNIKSHRLHNSEEEIKSGEIHDKDYIGMANDSAISFDVGVIKPRETKELEIFIYINKNEEVYKINDIQEKINKLIKINVNRELENTKKYWTNYVKEHDGLELLKSSKEEKWRNILENTQQPILNNSLEKVRDIYIRSILLFPLLSNSKTGGISAAIEIDEQTKKSGRYSYCWPRDAVFITKALDILKMDKQTTKFYTEFSKNTQSKTGMWEQRFYTDGKLAPCWGYQIDETASIVYGIYEHYKNIQDKDFLNKTYEMCNRAVKYLIKYIEYIIDNKIIDNKDRYVIAESYDLWEMNEGIHLYSLSAIYAAINSMSNIQKELITLKKEDKIEFIEETELEKYQEKILKYINENLINKEENTLKRNNKDNIIDISVLGTIYPFNMIDIESKELKNTIEKIELTLRTYTRGYIRFENDSYIGGNNPWPIATLWMALYKLKLQGDNSKKEALQCLEYVINSSTNHGYLAEQVDNSNMKPIWVIGLRMVACNVYNNIKCLAWGRFFSGHLSLNRTRKYINYSKNIAILKKMCYIFIIFIWGKY